MCACGRARTVNDIATCAACIEYAGPAHRVLVQGVGYKYVVYKTTDNGTETDVPQAPTFSEADKSQVSQDSYHFLLQQFGRDWSTLSDYMQSIKSRHTACTKIRR